MSAIPNPYNPLHPTEDPAVCTGRDEVFAFFRQHLVGTPADRALVLIGRRGLGKSTVLRQLQGQIDERYRVCVADLSRYDLGHEAGFLHGLADDIRAALEAAEASTYRLPDWPGEEADLRGWFKTQYLDVALAALRVRHLLLALDDAHLLLEAVDRGALPDDLLDYLGDLLIFYERLDMVFALDAALEDRTLTVPLLGDPARQVRLAELAPADAERLIRAPMEPVAAYEEGVPERIQALAGGHPFLIHSICRLLVRRSEERHHAGPVTDNDLTAIQEAVLEQSGEILGPLWEGLTRNEQLTLMALVRLAEEEQTPPVKRASFEAIHGWLAGAGYTMNKTQLAAALRGLDYQGLVDSEADSYTLPAGLIAAWVTANAHLEAAPQRPAVDRAQFMQLVGLIAVLLIVGGLGAAVLIGLFDSDDDGKTPVTPAAPTVTLALNLEATRQSEAATQTEAARPTRTPSPTHTPSITPTPTVTLSPSLTATSTVTPRPSRTPVPPTDTPEPSPTSSPTLDPGG